MRYATIKYCDIADGEGVRTTLFVSGCTHHCKGCFQPETWDFDYGDEFDDKVAHAVLESLEPPYVDGLTILGGEPMEPQNQRALAPFLALVREQYPGKTIWLYTGDTYESLVDSGNPRRTEVTDDILASIDVMVDGPYIEELKDISARFRGSSNQRLIDMAATRAQQAIVEWRGDETFATRGSW